MKLEVGKSYQSSNDNIVFIAETIVIDGELYFIDEIGRQYTSDGRISLVSNYPAAYDLVSAVQTATTPIKPESTHTTQSRTTICGYTDSVGNKWLLDAVDHVSNTGHIYRLIEIDTGKYFDFSFEPTMLSNMGFVKDSPLKIGDKFYPENPYLQAHAEVVKIQDAKAILIVYVYDLARDPVAVVTIGKTENSFLYGSRADKKFVLMTE